MSRKIITFCAVMLFMATTALSFYSKGNFAFGTLSSLILDATGPGGTFTVTIQKGINPHNNTVTYTIRDSAGAAVAATLTITKK